MASQPRRSLRKSAGRLASLSLQEPSSHDEGTASDSGGVHEASESDYAPDAESAESTEVVDDDLTVVDHGEVAETENEHPTGTRDEHPAGARDEEANRSGLEEPAAGGRRQSRAGRRGGTQSRHKPSASGQTRRPRNTGNAGALFRQAGMPIVTALQGAVLRAIHTELRGGHSIFPELGADHVFQDLRLQMRTWSSTLVYRRVMIDGNEAQPNALRLSLHGLVAQVVNNHASRSASAAGESHVYPHGRKMAKIN